MSQGGYATLVGFVAREPNLRPTKDGKNWADLRVGTTPRVRDRATGEWRDGDTSYYTVICFRRLADHVKASLRKGDPVLVKGRLKIATFEDRTTGRPRTQVEIVADTVGHDLNRGAANYLRPERARSDEAAGQAGDEAAGQAGGEAAGRAADEIADRPDAADIFDEEAMERFERELDTDLDEAARALDEDEPAAV
jgi:single-strand DNA-binding protein